MRFLGEFIEFIFGMVVISIFFIYPLGTIIYVIASLIYSWCIQ